MRYVVQTGDTLYTIAQKFNTTVDVLTRLNNISDPNVIYVGQVLIISEEGVPSPPPSVPTPPTVPSPPAVSTCPELRIGSRGVAVRRLQELLEAKGFEPGLLDGVFGIRTQTSVKSVQRQNNLPVTGIVDVATWRALGETCIDVTPPSQEYHCPVLRVGNTGPAVRFLQTLLRRKGIYRGEIDGIFGSRTQQAVREFQRRQGLMVTGVVNVATWEALGVKCITEPRPPVDSPVSTRVGRGIRHIFYTDKRVYSRGERIKMSLIKTNITDSEIDLRYSTSQIVEITAANSSGNIVWRYSTNQNFAQFTRIITIFPGGTQLINEYWDQRNDAGRQVLPGNYTLTITNLATNVSVSVQIQIR